MTTTKLEILKEEQIELMNIVKNEYIACLEKQINEKDAIDGSKFFYKLGGLKEPKAIILDSPYGAQIAANLVTEGQVLGKVGRQVREQVREQVWGQVWRQVREQVREQVKEQVWGQVWRQVREQVREQVKEQVGRQVEGQVGRQVDEQVREQVIEQVEGQVWGQVGRQVIEQVREQVREQVWGQVWGQVGRQVIEQVREQVREQVEGQVGRQVDEQVREQVIEQVEGQVEGQVDEQKLKYFSTSYDGLWSYHWVSFYDYFSRIGIVKNDLFEQYKKYIKSGVFSSIYFEDFVILSKNPIRISRDDKNRMSCVDRPAIEFADGYYQNYVHGVYFEPEIFDKAFIKKNMTSEDILKIRNTEQKAMIIKYNGYEKILNDIGAKKIDSWRQCELYEFKLDSIDVRVLKVKDHSTEKETFLTVPIEKGTSTARGAVAWTFEMGESEYEPMIET